MTAAKPGDRLDGLFVLEQKSRHRKSLMRPSRQGKLGQARTYRQELVTLLRVAGLPLAAGIVLFIVGSAWAACPEGDLYEDCRIDWRDLELLTRDWLKPGGTPADLTGDDGVDLHDFALFADNWGIVEQPEGSLFVSISPKTAIDLGAKWRINSGEWQESNQVLHGLPVGSYTVEFKPVGVWKGPSQRNVEIAQDLVIGIEATYRHPLVINEVLASNSSVKKDEWGQYDDWIEIYNSGDQGIDVGGMCLTDDLSNPTMWRIPANTTILAGHYLLIWADNGTGPSGLHASFELNATGEEVGLFDSDGATLLDDITFLDQDTDVSFGCFPDGNETLRFFGTPTPETENVDAYLGEIADIEFSHERGFYDTPFAITLSTDTEGAEIYYTLDGNEPGLVGMRSPTGTRYSSPIPISGTKLMRAKAVKAGWKPAGVYTHTYIFLDEIIDSDVMHKGITQDPVYGPQMRQALTGIPTVSLVTTNSISVTEVETSIEMIFPDGSGGFQTDAGVEHFGGHSLSNYPKKSMRLSFKGRYGQSRLKFDFFGDGAADEFDQLLLRAGSHDTPFYTNGTKGIYIRNRWMFDRQLDMGQAAPHGRFVHLYINGTYWGQYHLMERPNAPFMASYFGGHKDEYDALNASKPVNGDRRAWDATTRSTGNYSELQRYMDIENYADFMLLQFYGGNDWDWRPNQNWMAARRRQDGAGFKFFCWDSDMVLRRGLHTNVVSKGGPGNMWGSIKQHEEFRILLADRARKYFFNNGILTPDRVGYQFQEVAGRIDKSMIAECARWGQSLGYSPADWQQTLHTVQTDIIRNNDSAVNRTSVVIGQMRDAGVFPTIDGPAFNINGVHQHGGYVSDNDWLTITNPNGAGMVYYTLDGSDPRQPGAGGPGTSLTLVAESALKKTIVPEDDSIGSGWTGGDEPFDDSLWKSGAGGVGYDTQNTYKPYYSIDVIEMQNNNTMCYIRIPFGVDKEDLSKLISLNLRVRYDDAFVAFINGLKVYESSNVPATLRWNSGATDSHADSLATVFENFDITSYLHLVRQGDNILAIQGLNYLGRSSDFLISAELVAGRGSLAPGSVSDAAMALNGAILLEEATHVKARVLTSTEWSALNEAVYASPVVLESLRISEIMYHPIDRADPNDPNDPNEEYIELVNIGSETINLNLVKFTDGVDFTFGDVEVGAGEYVVVVEDLAAFEAKYGQGLAVAGQYDGNLANNGEKTELVDAIGTVIQEFEYDDDWRRVTDTEGYSLTIINPANPDPNSWSEKDSWRASAYAGGSPGADDSGIVPEPGAVVFNEILAHSHDEASDWIELYNTTGSAIDIGGWYLSDSASNLKKYRIATGTIIGAGQYKVFHETTHFGAGSVDPGKLVAFALSENGETAYLSSAIGGDLAGYRESQDVGASATSVSFGRYFKGSTGNYNFVPLSFPTPWQPNAYPKVGPVIISEISYNPSWPVAGSYTNDQYEYIEIKNISAVAITLYRQDKSEPWKITDGVDFTFPDVPNAATIAAGDYLIIARKPEAFLWRYPGVPAEKVLGPYQGSLSNSGERVQLSSPGDLDKFGVRQYIREDRVVYSDGSHPKDQPGGIDLWPTEADGGGKSLSRETAGEYGNDVANWRAWSPTPGSPNKP